MISASSLVRVAVCPASEDRMARIWNKLQPDTNGCWNWTGGTSGRSGDKNEYGKHSIHGGKTVRVHRFVFETLAGPIPPKSDLDHLCRNRLCSNPGHLEPVTRKVNILRGNGIAPRNAAKTRCDNGHPLSGDNLKLYGGRRYCRACHKDRSREWARRKRA